MFQGREQIILKLSKHFTTSSNLDGKYDYDMINLSKIGVEPLFHLHVLEI